MRRSSPGVLEGLNKRRGRGSVLFGDDNDEDGHTGGSGDDCVGAGADEKGSAGGGNYGSDSGVDTAAAVRLSEAAVAEVTSPPMMQGRRRSSTCDLAASSEAVMPRGRRSLSLFE